MGLGLLTSRPGVCLGWGEAQSSARSQIHLCSINPVQARGADGQGRTREKGGLWLLSPGPAPGEKMDRPMKGCHSAARVLQLPWPTKYPPGQIPLLESSQETPKAHPELE